MRLLGRLAELLAVQASALRVGKPPASAVIYVDPCTGDSHDARLQLAEDECSARGVAFVTVWSEAFACMLCSKSETTDEEAAEYRARLAPAAGEEAAWSEAVLPAGCEVLGVCCGSDSGLACAERLLHALAPARSNGVLNARRDKFEQHEALRAHGLEAARQAGATEWAEAERFLRTLPSPLHVVLKPRRGQGSTRVGLARSTAEAEALFARVLELPASLDEQADVSSVLLQEFLQGEEWVVDTMSRDGEHKVMALWRYDKGEANGVRATEARTEDRAQRPPRLHAVTRVLARPSWQAPFVYFGIEPRPAAGERALAMCEYAVAVLEALAWRWGPVHMEVMWVEGRGPVLVEANCGRLNGEEFKFLAEVCFGCTSYDAHFASLLGGDDEWRAVPPRPPEALRGAGRLVKLVAAGAGVVRAVNHLEHIYALPSFARLHLESEEGEWLKQTVDLNSCAGDVVLLHSEQAQVEEDYTALRQLQPTLFELEEEEETEGEAAGGEGPPPLSPAEKLRAEAEEVARIAGGLAAAHASDEGGAAPRWEQVAARFPLVGEYALAAPPGSAAARLATASPRRLGDALLRALRTARTEEEAVAALRALLEAPQAEAAGARTE